MDPREVRLVETYAQTAGPRRIGGAANASGSLATISFYLTKHLGAPGAVMTDTQILRYR